MQNFILKHQDMLNQQSKAQQEKNEEGKDDGTPKTWVQAL